MKSLKLAVHILILTAIPLLGMIGFYQISSTNESLDSNGKFLLKNKIAAEYQKYYLSKEDLSSVEKARLLTQIQKLEFKSLTALGSGDDLVVRVELKPLNIRPPQFSDIQYHQLKYSNLTGWRHNGKSTAVNFYLSTLQSYI